MSGLWRHRGGCPVATPTESRESRQEPLLTKLCRALLWSSLGDAACTSSSASPLLALRNALDIPFPVASAGRANHRNRPAARVRGCARCAFAHERRDCGWLHGRTGLDMGQHSGSVAPSGALLSRAAAHLASGRPCGVGGGDCCAAPAKQSSWSGRALPMAGRTAHVSQA